MYLLLTRPSDAGHTSFGDIFISQSRTCCTGVTTVA